MDYADLWLSVGGGVDAARHRVARYILVRILHVVPTYLPATRYGGPIFAVHGLCKALVARGHEVEVFTTNVDGDCVSDVPLGTGVQLDRVRWHSFLSTMRRLYYSP